MLVYDTAKHSEQAGPSDSSKARNLAQDNGSASAGKVMRVFVLGDLGSYTTRIRQAERTPADFSSF